MYLTGSRTTNLRDRADTISTGFMQVGASTLWLVDHTWQIANRVPAAQGPIVTIPALRQRRDSRRDAVAADPPVC